MSLLTTDGILNCLGERVQNRLDSLQVFSKLDSTNSYLLEQRCPLPGRCSIVLANYQTNGRGRMNRRWISPPSTGLCMSVSFTFERMPDNFASLSLAIGVGIAQALEDLGVAGIGVKWPNDLIAHDCKLGGVLPEIHPAKAGGVTVVVGFGLNIDLQNSESGTDIRSSLGPVIDLASCCDHLPARSAIAAASIDSIVETMVCFGTFGFSHFHDAWRKYDWLRGREVTIERPETRCGGIADGVDADGALRLNSGGMTRRITSGSVVLSGQPGTRT